MQVQLRYSPPASKNLVWDNFLALSSLAALGSIVTYLIAA
jgi:hypothetical protein